MQQGFPGLGIIDITAHFHCVGKWWIRSKELKRRTRKGIPFLGNALAILLSIPSEPGPLLRCSLRI